MLILTRRIGEVITIGETIEVMVTEIRGTRVSISVKAPAGIKIIRAELQDRKEDAA